LWDCRNSLWNDTLSRYNADFASTGTAIHVSTPQINHRSLLVQKIQMVQLCMMLKSEEAYTATGEYGTTQGAWNIPAISRRNPALYDSLLQKEMIWMEAFYPSERERFEEDKVEAMMQSLDVKQDPAKPPSPIKEDFTPDKVVMLWQACLPHVLSDMRSFKDANVNATLEDFKKWYQLDSESDIVALAASLQVSPGDYAEALSTLINQDALEQVWQSCEGMSAEAQRPMYRAETEFQKSVMYLETMTVAQVSTEMLIAVLQTCFGLLQSQLCIVLGCDESDIENQINGECGNDIHENEDKNQENSRERENTVSDYDVSNATPSSALEKLQQLRALTLKCIAEIREEGPSTVCDHRVDNFSSGTIKYNPERLQSIPQHVLLCVDDLCAKMHELETYVSRSHELFALLHFGEDSSTPMKMSAEERDFVAKLVSQGRAICPSEELRQRLHQLVEKCANHRKTHQWHSPDSRVLGAPSRKGFKVDAGIDGSVNVLYNRESAEMRINSIRSSV